jgi:hypothetical protein
MTTILNELAYHDIFSLVDVNRQVVQVLPHQIIVWVSLSPRDVLALDASTPRFPAVLDTGNSYGFAITEKHLEEWSGLTRPALQQIGTVNINRSSVPRLVAAVWLHSNKKGERDVISRRPPFRLDLRDGIAVFPSTSGIPAPRLPILGLRAIDENKLHCTIHGGRLRVTLRTSPRPRRPTPIK